MLLNWRFIVDTAGNLVPQGVAGELCFAGVQVGRGYWRLPERTAKSFVDCPFVKQDRWGRPVRMYHTGDLCRWNEEGQIEYMGRIDTQVKLRGFRIELGEIESKALNIEGIRQLNMISTSLMIRMGRVRDNRMVNMQLTNAKLVDRGTRMLQEYLGLDYDEARQRLLEAGSVNDALKSTYE